MRKNAIFVHQSVRTVRFKDDAEEYKESDQGSPMKIVKDNKTDWHNYDGKEI
jgi:hypothetical protein